MLLRNDALADCCTAFLLVDEIDGVPKLSFLVSRRMSVVDVNPAPSLRGLVGRFVPGLETFDEWIAQREAGAAFLTLNTCLLLDCGVLESTAVFFTVCNASHEKLAF